MALFVVVFSRVCLPLGCECVAKREKNLMCVCALARAWYHSPERQWVEMSKRDESTERRPPQSFCSVFDAVRFSMNNAFKLACPLSLRSSSEHLAVAAVSLVQWERLREIFTRPRNKFLWCSWPLKCHSSGKCIDQQGQLSFNFFHFRKKKKNMSVFTGVCVLWGFSYRYICQRWPGRRFESFVCLLYGSCVGWVASVGFLGSLSVDRLCH